MVGGARSDDEAGFVSPDFAQDVPLDPYLAACPASAGTRGTFFLHVRDLVGKELGAVPEALFDGLPRRKWLPFHTYPLREFMRLAHQGAGLAYPEVPRAEGLRRIGWMSYPSFAATMAGRVVLFALGERLEDVARAVPKAYGIGLPGATVTARELRPRLWRFELRDVHSFADTYHCGVIEGAARAFSLEPSMRVRRYKRLCDADIEITW